MKTQNTLTGKLYGKILFAILLLAIPVYLVISSSETIKLKEKDWYNGGYDPSYAYLFNSLNMATFKVSGHVDHPGTTMQVIGGVILKVAWNINPHGGSNLKEAVLANPEYYLRLLNISVAVLGALVLLIAGLFVLAVSKNIWYAILIQLSPFISGIVLFNGFTRISQESVLMISAIAMGTFALYWYFSEKINNKGTVIGFAVISGFGLASKIIFAPLMIIPLILIKGVKRKLIYLIYSLVAFFIFTLPILPMYPHMTNWFAGLFMHSGIYGSGEASVIDTENYLTSLKDLIISEPVYLAILTFTLLVLIILLVIKLFGKINTSRKELLILAALFLTQAFGYILIAKHPKVAYLLPYESLAAVNAIVLLNLFTKHFRNVLTINIIRGAIVILSLTLIIPYGLKDKNSLFSTENNSLNENGWNTASSKGYAVIGVNPGPSPIAAVYFGNAYSRDRYGEMLSTIYPDYYIYNTYSSQLENWKREPITLLDIYNKYNGKVRIITDQSMAASISDSLRKTGSNILIEPLISGHVTVMEVTMSKDSAELKSTVTNPSSPYAYTEIFDVVPGDKFRVSVLAKGDPTKAQIVASANNSQEFYVSEFTKLPDLSGWYEIKMDLELTTKISDGKLKIYCWNSGEGIVYFRDFSIEKN